ncbi:hypothetical protein V8C37DRAFT_413511 [Trichoderma ceciliae]
MDTTVEELERTKRRISETMREVQRAQNELNDILKFIETIEASNAIQMSGSASSARSRRKKNKGNTKTAEEELDSYRHKQAEKEESLGRLWEKLHDLQAKERNLKTA